MSDSVVTDIEVIRGSGGATGHAEEYVDDTLPAFPVKRGKGHPPIKRWKPIHDQVVMMYIQGISQVDIATALAMSIANVHRVVWDPTARNMVEAYRRRAREMFVEVVRDKLLALGPVAVDKIAETITAQFDVESPAKRHQDLMSFKLLGIIGVEMNSKREPRVVLDSEVQERLARALEESSELERSRSDG